MVAKKKKSESKPKKKKKVPRVKAIGFANYNPQVLVVFTAYSGNPDDRVFMFADSTDAFMLPEPEEGNNYVILTAPERITELRPHAKKIHRLLLFGKPEQLMDLKVPVADVQVGEDGKVTQISEQTIDGLRNKIEEEAVTVFLRKKKPKVVAKKLKKKKNAKKKAKKVLTMDDIDPTSLIDRLRLISSLFKGSKLDFENVVMIPTMLRFCKEIEKAEFRTICEAMVDHEITEELAESHYAFVESSQKTLGQAARKLLWPKNENKVPKIEKLASKYSVSGKDIKLVALSVSRLQKSLG